MTPVEAKELAKKLTQHLYEKGLFKEELEGEAEKEIACFLLGKERKYRKTTIDDLNRMLKGYGLNSEIED